MARLTCEIDVGDRVLLVELEGLTLEQKRMFAAAAASPGTYKVLVAFEGNDDPREAWCRRLHRESPALLRTLVGRTFARRRLATIAARRAPANRPRPRTGHRRRRCARGPPGSDPSRPCCCRASGLSTPEPRLRINGGEAPDAKPRRNAADAKG